MYSYIKGTVVDVTPNYVVIDNNNIGYLITVANPYLYHLNSIVTIYLYHYVREDLISLYGFHTKESRALFLKLISVKGIGPKSALSIIANDQIEEVILAIENNDVKFLSKFPGIGLKTSQQIILDLKGKLVDEETLIKVNEKNDAEQALLALGYKNAEVKRALKDVDSNLSVEKMIKEALRNILS